MQSSSCLLSPGQHSEGPLHFLVARAVPFCPQGPLQAPELQEDQPASPEKRPQHNSSLIQRNPYNNSQGQSPQVVSILNDGPSQNFPPLSGTGLLHVRTKTFLPPPPQDTVQGDASLQGDQPP